jgi:hypothetical protein
MKEGEKNQYRAGTRGNSKHRRAASLLGGDPQSMMNGNKAVLIARPVRLQLIPYRFYPVSV